MHELSLAFGILQLVDEAAAREQFHRVLQLRLKAGALAGVELPALRFALEVVARGTCLEGAVIDIDEPPGLALCRDCGQSVEVRERAQACPSCGSWRMLVRGGDALQVVDLIVDESLRGNEECRDVQGVRMRPDAWPG